MLPPPAPKRRCDTLEEPEVIPNADQLDAIAKVREGDLREVPFAVLLQALARAQRSAVIEIERGPLTKRILLEDGVPVDCTSNLLHETIGRFLVARGHLADDEARACLSKSVSAGISFGECAIVDGLITASELYRALQENLASKLLAVFTWREGRFHVSDDLPKLDSPLKVKVAQLVVTALTRFAPQAEIDGAVADLVGKRLFLHPLPAYALEEIRLTDAQRELAQRLAAGKRLDELAAETSIPFPAIVRLIYALAILGIVVPGPELPAEGEVAAGGDAGGEDAGTMPERLDTRPMPRPPKELIEAASTAASRAGAADPSSAARRSRESEPPPTRDELMATYLRHRKQDAFDLLGLAEDANLRQVEEAFLEFSHRFAPWRYAEGDLASLHDKAEDLFLAGGRAFGELWDRDSRDRLLARRRTLREQAKERSEAAADRFAIQSELLDSEKQYRRGKALMQAGRFREAVEQLQFAHDFDPQNSLYRAELAFSRFQADPSGNGEEAEQALQETVRIDPKFGLAWYYAGLVKTRRADPQGAEECLRKAIKLMAPDRRPIDALKSLAAEGGTGRAPKAR